MARPRSHGTQMGLRLDPAILDRADALIDAVSASRGAPASRADVIREAILRGLRALEKGAA